jgi:inner membrane protein
MDPFTQGALGAAFAQATPTKAHNIRIAAGLGFISGMAADLDVLISSSTDPLTFLEYHRHFTHSLAFIPLGGLLCAGVLHLIMRQRWPLTFLQSFSFCTLGYATHGLLDAATSYGTMLLWPFSDERISWSIVPIVDPLFTLPLAILIGLSALKRRALYARIAMGWVGFYLTMGALQHNAAIDMGKQLAENRGHTLIRIDAKPSFANIIVWKTIYETRHGFHVDAVRAGLAPRVFEGASVPKLDLGQDLPWLDPTSQQAKDVERFMVFSDGFVAEDPDTPNRIVDIRYSFVPNEVRPLWSIEVSPEATPNAHAVYLTHRGDARKGLAQLWQMLTTN